MSVRSCGGHNSLEPMTDAVSTQRVAAAAPTGVTDPLRGLVSRAAHLVRDRGTLESVAILLPIVLVGATHARGPWLWLAAAAYVVVSMTLAIRAPSRSAA